MPDQPDRGPFVRWVIATTLGWLLGFVLVIVQALIWDAIGARVQLIVGVGIGAGVGYMQSRMIGEWIDSPLRWLWASLLGMGTPFVIWDLAAVFGFGRVLALPHCVLIGSVLVGILQGRLLRPRFRRAWWWIPACVVGWGLPAGAIALEQAGLLPVLTRVLSLVAMFAGGVIVGAVTGLALLWIAGQERSDLETAPADRG